ncbi:MAG: hypothetical protein CW338_09140 [Clostridiales bacterium]|nr:hypothetical protein [Clostridiales bacterium]
MDSFADERDIRLLENDRYTFFVLSRIVGGPCRLLLTDHERLIICYTGDPYPVWIWTRDGAAEEELERAYAAADGQGLLNGEYHFNLKYDLAEYFIRRGKAEGKKFRIKTNMFAYDNPRSAAPHKRADGYLHTCTTEDTDELVDLIEQFHNETVDRQDRNAYRQQAAVFIGSGRMFFWKDQAGRTVACCKYAPSNGLASVNLVYTKPEFRRKHYAENLVYQVTVKAAEEGLLPMLYTDADYAASNACYMKIGYIPRGGLCTLAAE